MATSPHHAWDAHCDRLDAADIEIEVAATEALERPGVRQALALHTLAKIVGDEGAVTALEDGTLWAAADASCGECDVLHVRAALIGYAPTQAAAAKLLASAAPVSVGAN